MTVLPVMFQTQRICTNLGAPTNCLTIPAQASADANSSRYLLPPAGTTHLKTWQRQVPVSSWLEWLGIYQWKTVRYARRKSNRRHSSRLEAGDIVLHNHDIILAWTLLKLGIQWSRPHAFGGIAASLSVYPVVENVYVHYDLIGKAPIDEIQQRFVSGALHPFTRDLEGYSLLHVSICQRAPEFDTDQQRSWQPCIVDLTSAASFSSMV